MKFSSIVICKTSKSQFKMSIYLLEYIVAKQNVYHMKELFARKNVHICAQHVYFKRARFQVSYRFILKEISCNLRNSPYRRKLAVKIFNGRIINKSVAMIFSYPYFSKSEYVSSIHMTALYEELIKS